MALASGEVSSLEVVGSNPERFFLQELPKIERFPRFQSAFKPERETTIHLCSLEREATGSVYIPESMNISWDGRSLTIADQGVNYPNIDPQSEGPFEILRIKPAKDLKAENGELVRPPVYFAGEGYHCLLCRSPYEGYKPDFEKIIEMINAQNKIIIALPGSVPQVYATVSYVAVINGLKSDYYINY